MTNKYAPYSEIFKSFFSPWRWLPPFSQRYIILPASLPASPHSTFSHKKKIRERQSVWSLNKLLASLSVQKKKKIRHASYLLLPWWPPCKMKPGPRCRLHKAFLMLHVNWLNSSKAALLRLSLGQDLTGTQRKKRNTESYNLPWK